MLCQIASELIVNSADNRALSRVIVNLKVYVTQWLVQALRMFNKYSANAFDVCFSQYEVRLFVPILFSISTMLRRRSLG